MHINLHPRSVNCTLCRLYKLQTIYRGCIARVTWCQENPRSHNLWRYDIALPRINTAESGLRPQMTEPDSGTTGASEDAVYPNNSREQSEITKLQILHWPVITRTENALHLVKPASTAGRTTSPMLVTHHQLLLVSQNQFLLRKNTGRNASNVARTTATLQTTDLYLEWQRMIDRSFVLSIGCGFTA